VRNVPRDLSGWSWRFLAQSAAGVWCLGRLLGKFNSGDGRDTSRRCLYYHTYSVGGIKDGDEKIV
jgi:hypothetical protein